MAFTENIKLVVDVVTGNAQSAMGKLKTDVANAEGAFGKLKAGAGGAFSSIGQMGPQIVASAGAAIGAFAVKGVQDFQKIALAANQFSQASGMGIEDSSRWLEVADHIDVSEQAVSSAFRRMGVAIGNNTAGWQALGIETAKNADGSINLSETFLKVVTSLQQIEDPTKRAAAAQKLFGKGYAEVAELIGKSAPELKRMLEEVGDAKIINEDERAKALEMRGAMDDLGDSVQELGIMVGQSLVPVLSDAAAMLAEIIAMADDIGAGFDKANKASGGWLGTLKDTAIEAINPIEGVRRKWGELFGASDQAAEGVEKVTAAILDGKDGAAGYAEAHGQAIGVMSHFGASADSVAEKLDNNVTGMLELGASADAVAENIGNESQALEDLAKAADAAFAAQLQLVDSTFAQHKAQQDVVDSQTALNEAIEDGTKTELEMTIATDEVVASSIKLATINADVASSSGDAKDGQDAFIATLQFLSSTASPEVKAQLDGVIAKLIETGDQHPEPDLTLNDQATQPLIDVKGKIDGLDGARANLAADETGNALSRLGQIESSIRRINGMRLGVSTTLPGGAAGFTNFRGGLAIVGEQGPELVNLPRGSDVLPTGPTQAMMGAPRGLNGNGHGPGRTYNITISGLVIDPIATGRAIKQAIAQAERVGVI